MTVKINLSKLPTSAIEAVLNHFIELDDVRTSGDNALVNALLGVPDLPASIRSMVTSWAATCNEVSQKSEAEIARIVSGRPRQLN